MQFCGITWMSVCCCFLLLFCMIVWLSKRMAGYSHGIDKLERKARFPADFPLNHLSDSCLFNMEVSRNRGTPSHHSFQSGIFHYKPSILGYPQPYGNPHILQYISISKAWSYDQRLSLSRSRRCDKQLFDCGRSVHVGIAYRNSFAANHKQVHDLVQQYYHM